MNNTHRSILYMRERCNTNTRHPKMYLKFFRKVQRLYRSYHFSIIRLNSSLEWQLSKHGQRELDRKSTSFHVQLLSLLMQVFSKTPEICSCKRPTELLGFFQQSSLSFLHHSAPHTHSTGAAFTSLRHITEILPRARPNN